MYYQFNIQQFYIRPHSVFMCFVWISEQTVIIPYTTLTDWIV